MSRLRNAVHVTATRAKRSQSSQTRCRPHRATRWPMTSNTPASWAISATTVMVRRKTTIGPSRDVSTPRSSPGHRPGGETSRTQGAAGACRGMERDGEATGDHLGEGRGRSWRRALEAEVAGDEPPGVLGEVARPGHLDGDPAVGEVAPGWPGGGIRGGPAVDDDAASGVRRQHPRQLGAPEGRQRAEPGQADPHGEAVGRDPVGEADGAVERGDDDEPPGGPPAGRGIEGGEVERVVEDSGVDLAGGGGGRGVEDEVAGDLVEQRGADAEQLRCARGAAHLAQGLGHPGAGVGELGVAEGRGVDGSTAAAPRLGLRRRQEDQHGDTIGGSGPGAGRVRL